MKRTFKRTDGTEEVLEGSAEELALYEKQLRESGKLDETAPVKPTVLHGKPAVDGVELTDDEIAWVRTWRTVGQKLIEPLVYPDPFGIVQEPPWWTGKGKIGTPIWLVSCSICHRPGCDGSCFMRGTGPWWTLGDSTAE